MSYNMSHDILNKVQCWVVKLLKSENRIVLSSCRYEVVVESPEMKLHGYFRVYGNGTETIDIVVTYPNGDTESANIDKYCRGSGTCKYRKKCINEPLRYENWEIDANGAAKVTCNEGHSQLILPSDFRPWE